MNGLASETELYGTVAEFDDPTALVEAARKVKEEGFQKFEAYTPYPIKDLDGIVPGFNLVPPIVLIGGLLGAATAWSMQYYIAAIDYPINVGGRPLYSWPAFIPILFELTVLFAGCSAFFGTLALCGFPRPHFPLFNLPDFANATSSRFFLCIEKRDPMYEARFIARLFRDLDAVGVWEVDNS
jgi:pimeloyl-ACP methyl ester carboxylesterase